MGRFVDLDKPLSDDDREYLISRRREDEVRINDARFKSLSEEEKQEATRQQDQDAAEERAEQEALEQAIAHQEEDAYPEHIVEKIAPLNLTQLRQAAKKRGLETTGSKEELRIRLCDYFEAKEKAEEEAAAEAEANLRLKQQPEPEITYPGE